MLYARDKVSGEAVLHGSLWREDLRAWSWRISTVTSRCQEAASEDTADWKMLSGRCGNLWIVKISGVAVTACSSEWFLEVVNKSIHQSNPRLYSLKSWHYIEVTEDVPWINSHPPLPTFSSSCCAPHSSALPYCPSIRLVILFTGILVSITLTGLPPVCWLLAWLILFDLDEEASMFIWNVRVSPTYTALLPRIPRYSWFCEDLESVVNCSTCPMATHAHWNPLQGPNHFQYPHMPICLNAHRWNLLQYVWQSLFFVGRSVALVYRRLRNLGRVSLKRIMRAVQMRLTSSLQTTIHCAHDPHDCS
jgi:hypothetical protein